MGERERERELEDSMASEAASLNASSETFAAQHSIDNLFDRSHSQSEWEPAKAPQVLGELLDSRHMLPLFLPSGLIYPLGTTAAFGIIPIVFMLQALQIVNVVLTSVGKLNSFASV